MNFDNVTEWKIPVNGIQRDVLKVTRNNIVLWEKQTAPDYTEPFYVENIKSFNEYLRIVKTNSYAPTLTIEYSTDKTTWSTLGTTSTSELTLQLNPGNKVYLRCNTTSWWGSGSGRNAICGISKIGGNIMSLLYGSSFTGQETIFPTNSGHEFFSIFRYNSSYDKLENASRLLLPATTLNAYCYYGLFAGCKSLTAAPKLLPATTLVNYCYYQMFDGCTSLTDSPVLPATTLADSCYRNMFHGCISLTTAPALTATTVADNCYHDMFAGCTSLTTAPALPATTLADSCYSSMFDGCTSLTAAPALPATTLATYCYSNMFQICTSLTTAPALPATTLADSCYSSMFYGCTSLTTAPALPATALANYCYYSMFDSCTSLTAAPELYAIRLTSSCYNYMFFGCTALNSVTCLATINVNSGNLMGWLGNVSSTGTFTKAAGVTWPTGASGIPSGWTVIEA